GISDETEKPLLAYKPGQEILVWKNQSPVVLWQLHLFIEALVAAHDEAEDCMIDLDIDAYLTKRWRRRKRVKYTRGLAVCKAQQKAVAKIEMGVIRDGNMGEALQAAFDRIQIALIENTTRVNFLLSMLKPIRQIGSSASRLALRDPSKLMRSCRTNSRIHLMMADSVNGNGNPPTSTPTSEGISAQDIAAVTKLVSVALEHLDTREVEEQPKTAEDYQMLLKKKEELMTLYNRVLQMLSFTRLRSEGESQAPKIETVNELGTGYSTLLKGVESVLARVIVWIEEYEHDNGINNGVSGSSFARTA
ncbi:hypothetical protein CaCOL14_005132, partial [Colletotrichum acutatum]